MVLQLLQVDNGGHVEQRQEVLKELVRWRVQHLGCLGHLLLAVAATGHEVHFAVNISGLLNDAAVLLVKLVEGLLVTGLVPVGFVGFQQQVQLVEV